MACREAARGPRLEYQVTERGSIEELSFQQPMEMDTLQYMAKAMDWPFVTPDSHCVSCGTLRKVSLSLALTKRCVPLVFNRRRVVLMVDDPLSGSVLLANPQLLGPPYRRRVEIALTTPRVLDVLLDKRRRLVR